MNCTVCGIDIGAGGHWVNNEPVCRHHFLESLRDNRLYDENIEEYNGKANYPISFTEGG